MNIRLTAPRPTTSLRIAAASISRACLLTFLAILGGSVMSDGTRAGPASAATIQPLQASLTEAYRLMETWQSRPEPPSPDALLEPTGVTVDPFDARVFVVDSGNNRVQVYEPDGAYVRSLMGVVGQPSELVEPKDVAVQGSLAFVTDYGHDRVALFDIDGGYVGEWAGLSDPWGIAAHADGRVLVTEESGRVLVFRADGVRLDEWSFGTTLLRGIDVTPDGRAVLVNAGTRSVRIVRADGTEQRSSDELPDAPIDVAVDDGGSLWVSFAGGRVARLADQLNLPETDSIMVGGAVGLAAGPNGRLYTTFQDEEAPQHGVQLWSGRPIAPERAWGSVPAPLGVLDEPERIAAADSVLIVDAWRRVQRFDADGQARGQVPAANVTDLAVGPGQSVLLAREDSVSRVNTETGLVEWSWTVPPVTGEYAWIVAVAWDPDDDRLAALDIGRQRLWHLSGEGTELEGQRLGSGVPIPLWDVALSGVDNGFLVVNRRADTIERRDAEGRRVIVSWEVPGGALRVASDESGNAYVLNRHGWVLKYSADGALLAAWQSTDVAAESRVVDLAVDEAGRVLVVDRGLHRVRVFERDPGGTPGTVPSFIPRCQAVGDKSADPTYLRLGEETTVTLRVDGACPALDSEADIVLAIDVSGSMSAPAVGRPGTKMDAARDAAADFLELIDFASFQVGVVAFNSEAALVTPLTPNPIEARAGVIGLTAGGGTDISAGVDVARAELTGPRRRFEVNGVIVLLTDGFSDPLAAMRAADMARLEGVRLFTVGFGDAVNEQLLRDMASAPSDFYLAPTAAELQPIYSELAQRIASSVLFTTLTVTDELPDNMQLVAGSGSPPPVVDGKILQWVLSDVPMSGTELVYRVRPLETGVWPTNVLAVGEGTDGLGQPGQVEFPVPEVQVVAPSGTPPPTPTATQTATPGPTATPTLTPEPASVYLPALRNEVCIKRRQHVDVVLVIDTSNSMLDRTSAGRTKLAAAAEAAKTFVALLDFGSSEGDGGDAAGLVAFNTEARTMTGLTRDQARLDEAIAGMPQAAGTRIDLGLHAASSVLSGAGRSPENLGVVILLTDGRPSGTTPDDVLARAEELRGSGAVIYGIGLGSDVDPDLLRGITGDRQRVLLAPDAEDLAAIYSEIARELPCVRPD